MNKSCYETYQIEVPFMPIKVMLEKAKSLKTDTVLIPQTPYNINPFKIVGVSANSIFTIADFDDLKYQIGENPTILWNENDLIYVQLYLKDISPFLKIITDTAESYARKELKITDPKVKTPKEVIPAYFPKMCTLTCHRYMINNKSRSIATHLAVYDKDGNIMTNTLGNNTVTNSFINLYDFDIDRNVGEILSCMKASNKVVEDLDITEDPVLNSILTSKTTEGAKLWIPNGDRRLSRYITYINKAFLNISKGDKVYLTIYDRLPSMNYRYYMMNFKIDKAKKGIHLNTSFIAFSLTD